MNQNLRVNKTNFHNYERLCTRTLSETEAKCNSEIAYRDKLLDSNVGIRSHCVNKVEMCIEITQEYTMRLPFRQIDLVVCNTAPRRCLILLAIISTHNILSYRTRNLNVLCKN